MQRAFDQFTANIKYIRELGALHDYLVNEQKLPNDISDILRAKWVYTISALDKMIHEVVRIGMVQSFLDLRLKTTRFNAFTISLNTFNNIKSNTIPPPEFWFEQEVVQKHKILSFQDPDKINDALGLIWNEEHKWQKISDSMGYNERDLKIRLKNIVNRRNQIVHEADIDLQTGVRSIIDLTDTIETVDFIEKLCKTIFMFIQ